MKDFVIPIYFQCLDNTFTYLRGQEVGDLSCNSASVCHVSSRFKGALMSIRSKRVKTRMATLGKEEKMKGDLESLYLSLFPNSP